ncbi:MAG: DUF2332 domain-containing protein [Nocardioidaceae bacterium]
MSSSPADRFRVQANACAELGSPLYASLLTSCADDIDAGGPVAAVLAGHEHDTGPSALALRLMGAVHRRVLQGDASALAAHYPSVGGDGDAHAAWLALRRVVAEQAAQLRPLLDSAPQTNEVGRATALVGGLLHLADRFGLPVRLHEIGTSAGLNLRADHFCYRDQNGVRLWGPPDSPVQLGDAWRGRLPPLQAPLRVVERHGTDLAPVDPTTADGEHRLLSYVWADMTARIKRACAAIAVARAVPATVAALDAVSAVRRLELRQGHATVLWHSVMWQYLDLADQRAVDRRLDELGAQASDSAPFAHLVLEPLRRRPGAEHEFLVVLRTWPGDRQILGTSAAHGVPTIWQ